MKAWILKKYGSPDHLQLQDVPEPIPNDDEVLIRVHAASINDWDGCLVHGKPFYIRLLCGLFRPKVKIPGVDVAGQVVAVGEQVTQFRPGDAVYGDLSQCGFGAFAEYVCAREKDIASMPPRMSFVHAAALPHAAMLAIQGLRDVSQIKPEHSLLINGAGGGAGTLGIQIARAMGVENIDGVDSHSKLAGMRRVGFQTTIDYQKQDFTRLGKRYDVILDAKTTRTLFSLRRALKPKGRYTTLGGHTGKLLQTFCLSRVVHLLGKKRYALLNLKPNQDLSYVSQLYESGKLKPVIDGPWSFEDLPQAIRRFREAKHLGKVVITLSDATTPLSAAMGGN